MLLFNANEVWEESAVNQSIGFPKEQRSRQKGMRPLKGNMCK